MKSIGVYGLSMLLVCSLDAQQPAPTSQAGQPAAQKSISGQLGLHAFPGKGQSAEQQQTDEIACYKWAKQDTGFDPVASLTAQASKNSAGPTGSAGSGSPQRGGARGAAGGAAAGAAVGAIAGDAGKGAAIGAAGGGIRGRMAQRRAQAEAQQKAQQQEQQQAQQQAQTKAQAGLDDFKKAYSACMDAKGYSIK